MKVGIVGLGLIGGSLARAYKRKNNTVYAMDTDNTILDVAKMISVVDDNLDKDNIGECDLVIIALYPKNAVTYLETMAPYIASKTIVIDCCGVKEEICEKGFEIAGRYGFTFVGGHPMAGKQYSGFKYSSEDLFEDASMIIVPEKCDDIEFLDKVKSMLMPVGFGKITVCSAKEHDKVISFTSQMPHIVSNAFIKSPTAKNHVGFSAGSYKDLTRVAWLNENMWTELFFENKDNLIYELDGFIHELTKYRDAIKNNDRDEMRELLRDGRICKEEVDG
ncbi:MAG: prephenate dehydrogenase/arogenate dehydrogenase family protein [Lachnospiraceae bacterium]|nr:prephenate dehydrogenase/arogenate dehydrogenase family protein [Lachnospiraceae bacterium]